MLLMPPDDGSTSGDLPIVPDIELVPAYSPLGEPVMETEWHSPSLDDCALRDNG
jgi:hypothetical protein